MNPVRVNITDTRGDAWRIRVELDDGAEPGATPTNLTGYTARAQVRQSPGSSRAIDFEVTNAPLDGDGIIELTALETSPAWLCGDVPIVCSWDLELVNPAGEPDTIAGGAWTVKPDTTRAVL